MSIRFLNARKLAHELADGKVSLTDRAHYLLTYLLLFIPIFYLNFALGSAGLGWMGMYEAVALIVVIVIGFVKVFEAGRGESNPHFITQFMCLLVPVTLTSVLYVWGAYWVITWLFGDALLAWSYSSLQITASLYAIGSDLIGLLTLLAVVLTEVVIFTRLVPLMRHVQQAPQ